MRRVSRHEIELGSRTIDGYSCGLIRILIDRGASSYPENISCRYVKLAGVSVNNEKNLLLVHANQRQE